MEEADNWLDDDASGVDKGSYEPAMPLLKDDDGSLDPDFAAAEDIDAKREKKRLKKEAKKAAKMEKKLAMQNVLDESDIGASVAVKDEGAGAPTTKKRKMRRMVEFEDQPVASESNPPAEPAENQAAAKDEDVEMKE